MSTARNHLEFAPPSTPGILRALMLAILAHTALVAMLTLGVQWKHTSTPVTVEAELWSAVPQQAAPPAAEPTLTTGPEQLPNPPSEPLPEPAPTPTTTPTPSLPAPDADIAIARKKEQERLQLEQQLREEKLEQERQTRLKQERLEKDRIEKERAEKARLEKERAEKEKLAQTKLEQEKNAKNIDASRKQAQKDQEEARKLAELRADNLRRMAGLAGNTGVGGTGMGGSAAQSSGPSAGYGGRIIARIKPNITYTENIVGNPSAEVEVRLSPDGTIISRKISQSSGVKSWDDAVINAIDKTEKLPPDTNGRAPNTIVIIFRPKD